jgi:hypothetical protein
MHPRGIIRTISATKLAALCPASLFVAALVAAPAHAGWIGGAARPPIVKDEQVCRNGLALRVAHMPPVDATGNEVVPAPATRVLERVTTSSPVQSTPGTPVPVGSGAILTSGPLTVPRNPIYVDPTKIGGDGDPTGGTGIFAYSGIYTMEFPRLVNSLGTAPALQLDWPREQVPVSFASVQYPVANCVLIDVDPGEFPNDVNPRIPRSEVDVAVLTTPAFDAAKRVNVSSARLGTGTPTAKPRDHANVDIDGDNDTDVILRFRIADAKITCTSTTVTLKANLSTGGNITGKDSVGCAS